MADDRIDEALAVAAARRARPGAVRRRRGSGPRAAARARRRAVARAVPCALGRAGSATCSAVLRAWRGNAEVQAALLEAQRPWDQEGPLRWQGRGRRARLVGRHLPAAATPFRPSSSPRRSL